MNLSCSTCHNFTSLTVSWPSACYNDMVPVSCEYSIFSWNYTYKNYIPKDEIFVYCTENGTWENEDEAEAFCLIPHVRALKQLCNRLGPNECLEIAKTSRIIEIVGLCLSIPSILISLYIFSSYRILSNNRTKIHTNLFIATLLQDLFRLIIYIDQGSFNNEILKNHHYINESCIFLLEYARTAMFFWMFLEGLYLHNMITISVFQEDSYIKIYFHSGWIGSAVITLIWLTVMCFKIKNWDHYYFVEYYWILEGPRMVLIMVNFIFLLNIIRILVAKLRESHTSDLEQIRKAVRAALILLPLMGITHMLHLVYFLDSFDKPWKFAAWSYVTLFLNNIQGFFVAVIYCFLNKEVQRAIKNNFYLRLSLRNFDYARYLTVVSSADPPTTKRKWWRWRINDKSLEEVHLNT